MQPVFHEGLAGGTFALGYLILVMGESKIFATEVEVEGVAQQFHAHGAALDVPAGPPFAPRAGPEHLAIFGHAGLP